MHVCIPLQFFQHIALDFFIRTDANGHMRVSFPFFTSLRAFPHSKARLGRVWGHAPLRRLNLSGASISRKCHENVMSSVMGHDPNAVPPTSEQARDRQNTNSPISINLRIKQSPIQTIEQELRRIGLSLTGVQAT